MTDAALIFCGTALLVAATVAESKGMGGASYALSVVGMLMIFYGASHGE